MSHLSDDREWNGYEPGSYSLIERLVKVYDRILCKAAENIAEERTPEGPITITFADVRKAIANTDLAEYSLPEKLRKDLRGP